MSEIKYPTWKVRGGPTPAETLWICDDCGRGHWGWPNVIEHCSCEGRKGGRKRMRRATAAETKAGKLALKEIIGDVTPPPPRTARTAAKLPPGVKPQFVLQFIDSYPGLYYCDTVAFNGVSREQATKMSHKRVHAAQGHLKRVGCKTVVEPA